MPSCSVRRHRWWASCPMLPTGTSPTGTSSWPRSPPRPCANWPPAWLPASPRCAASTAIPPRPAAGWARSAGRTWSSPARSRGCSPPRSPCPTSTATALPAAGPGRTPCPWISSARSSTNWPTPACSTGSAATASSTPSGPRCTGWPCSPGKARCASSPTPPAVTSRSSPPPSSARPWGKPARDETFLTRSAFTPVTGVPAVGVCTTRCPVARVRRAASMAGPCCSCLAAHAGGPRSRGGPRMRRTTFRFMARRPRLRRSAAVLAAASLGCAGLATSAASAPGFAASTGSLMVAPHSFSVAQGTSEVFGVSLSAAPSANVTVTVRRSAGNTGLTVSAGPTLTFTPSNWNYPQPVTVTADTSSTGSAKFTARAPGYPAKGVTGLETAAGPAMNPAHVVNPFTGATWYVNPNYTAEVATSAAGASGTLKAQMTLVGRQPTGVWLDHIGAIYGGVDSSGRRGLEAHLRGALHQESGTKPILVPIVVYDLPNRDCAALASNGELTVSNNGLTYYEQDYINPIAQILSNFQHTNIRVIAIIEPDSLPNLVTNLSKSACAEANSSGAYVTGIQYALNRLHAIPNVYNYVDITHSAWLGWSSNMARP